MRVSSRLLLLAGVLGMLAIFAGIYVGASGDAPLFGLADFEPAMLTAIIPGACACLLSVIVMLRAPRGPDEAPIGRWYADAPLPIFAVGLMAIATPFVMGLVIGVILLFVVGASMS